MISGRFVKSSVRALRCDSIKLRLFNPLASETGTVFLHTTQLQQLDVLRCSETLSARRKSLSVLRSGTLRYIWADESKHALLRERTRHRLRKNVSKFLVLCVVMITIAWKNKGTAHGLACLKNVKTSTKRIGKAHNRHDHPPTHTGYAFHCLSIFLFTLLAYSLAQHIPSLWLLIPRVHPKAVRLRAAALDAACFCPCAIVLKTQQPMKWTNGRLMFGEINNFAIKVTIVI